MLIELLLLPPERRLVFDQNPDWRRWCSIYDRSHGTDHFFDLARNEVRLKKARRARCMAAMAMIETGQPVRAYGDFHHSGVLVAGKARNNASLNRTVIYSSRV